MIVIARQGPVNLKQMLIPYLAGSLDCLQMTSPQTVPENWYAGLMFLILIFCLLLYMIIWLRTLQIGFNVLEWELDFQYMQCCFMVSFWLVLLALLKRSKKNYYSHKQWLGNVSLFSYNNSIKFCRHVGIFSYQPWVLHQHWHKE